jgi:hypothetical protein
MKFRALFFSLLLFVSVPLVSMSACAGDVEAPGVVEPPPDSPYVWQYDVVTNLWYITY